MRAGDVAQSVPAPNPAAFSVHSLWQLMFWLAVTVFTLVIAFLIAALVRGLQRKRDGLALFAAWRREPERRARFHRVVRSARL